MPRTAFSIAAGCDVTVAAADAERAQLAALAAASDALLGATFRGSIDREFLTLSPQLRIVAKYTIGVDDVDVDAASELGVLVTHSPDRSELGRRRRRRAGLDARAC